MKRQTKKIYFWIIFILVFALLLFVVTKFVYYPIIEPSYYSVVTGCGYMTEEEMQLKGYEWGGQTIINETTKEITIVIYVSEEHELYKRTLKHENVHVVQYAQNRVFSCRYPILRFFNEVEANIGMYLPDFVYEIVY